MATRVKDIIRKYLYVVDLKTKNDFSCNFCGKIAKEWAYINII